VRIEEFEHDPFWFRKKCAELFAAEGRALAAGLPSLLAAAVALCVAASAATTPSSRYLDGYAKEAQRKMEVRDFETALLCYQWLLRVDGDRPELRCAQAEAYQGKGEHGRALAIVEKIAPLDAPGGYSPAHLAAARMLLDGDDRSDRAKWAIELHLQRALNGSVAAEAGVLLGLVYAASGRGNLAEPYLLKAVGTQPELLFPLARIARDQGREDLARERADMARRIYRRRTEARLDDPESRLAWTTATVLLGDYADAIAILEKGQKVSADARYPAAAAQVYADWACSRPEGKPLSVATRLSLLERGLKADPNNLALLHEFGTMFERGGDEVDRGRTILLSTLTTGKAGAGTYSLLGFDAHTHGQADRSRAYWEQAFRLDPSMALVANNLAWVLAHEASPDLPRALELAERALSREPNNPRFRGTRGYVLWQLRRWSEALADLNVELAAFPERTQTHRALADVYEHLGMPEPAAAHLTAATRTESPRGG
jgi:tetratricopeptide (TPR) repeat protein